MKNARVFSGRAHLVLAKEIAQKLNIDLGKIRIENFPDSEIHCQIEESIRGKNVYIIQPICYPINENIMELLIMVDAFKRASSGTINAVIPYFGYCRQNKKSKSREPISVKLIMNLLATAGVDRIISIDLHKSQIQAYFDKPFDNLSACALISNYIKTKDIPNPVIVAPDVGKAKLAEKYSNVLGYPIIIMYKKKYDKTKSLFGGIIGNPEGKTPIIIDDIIANGTAVDQALAFLDYGANKEIYFAVTHPILTQKAMEKLTNDAIKEVIVTNSVPVGAKRDILPKITILSLADLLSEVIYRVQTNQSISNLFHQQKLDIPV